MFFFVGGGFCPDGYGGGVFGGGGEFWSGVLVREFGRGVLVWWFYPRGFGRGVLSIFFCLRGFWRGGGLVGGFGRGVCRGGFGRGVLVGGFGRGFW